MIPYILNDFLKSALHNLDKLALVNLAVSIQRESLLTVDVTNTGKRDGAEVVQVYLRDPADTEGPLKSLRAFQRVEVKAGQTVPVTLTLDRKAFEFWDAETNTMRTKSGSYELYYGNSSQDKDLKKLMINY